uniref:Putative secreted protein n=1 Tax=Ixodes ricinus TaxID=34613 RepID=A0A6B0UAL5_IXORI
MKDVLKVYLVTVAVLMADIGSSLTALTCSTKTSPPTRVLFGQVRPSLVHAKRICRVLRSELWRQWITHTRWMDMVCLLEETMCGRPNLPLPIMMLR